MCANEEWRPIDGYEGYFVSNMGRVKSSDSLIPNNNGTMRVHKGRILKPSVRKNGELYCNFAKNGKQSPIPIDKLVASAFLPHEESQRYVIHKNGLTDDVRADNLMWCTADEAIAAMPACKDCENLPNETWKAVNGWEGFYEISNMGRLRSVAREVNSAWGTPCIREGKLFDLNPSKNGRRQHVCLYRDSKPTFAHIDKLVVDAFIPSEDGDDFIRHVNGDLNDCRLENLERIPKTTHILSTDHVPDIDQYGIDSEVEEWRPVKGFESTYEMSNLGRLRSLPRHVDATDGRSYDLKGRLISLSPSKANGYVYANLHKDGERTCAMVHVLVAEAFLGEKPDGCVVDHINRLRNDNRVSNLRYASVSQNCCNRSRYGDPKTLAYAKEVNIKPLKNEYWKEIAGYDGYLVSSAGRVFSLKSQKLLSQGLHTGGYRKVCLCKDGKPEGHFVHRLVAEAFIPNPRDYPQVNHKDEDKTNNHVSNLEWCDQAYNNIYGTKLERGALNKGFPIIQCDMDGNVVKIWNHAKEASRVLGMNYSGINRACSRKGSYTDGIFNGYVWSYVREENVEKAS